MPTTTCANCDAPLTDRFCAACGQEARSLQVAAWTLALDYLGDAFSWDSRLWRTFGPLFLRPGHLTREYMEGRRARYVPPMRLYLLASFAMFLVIAASPSFSVEPRSAASATIGWSKADHAALDPARPAPSRRALALTLDGEVGNLGELKKALRERPGQVRASYLARASQLVIFLLPLFALLLKLLYPGRFYVQHLVFATHLHVALFLVAAIVALPSVFGAGVLTAALSPLLLLFPVQLVMGLRRTCEVPWPRAILGTMVLLFTHGLLLATISLASLLLISV